MYDNLLMYENANKLANDIRAAVLDFPSDEDEMVYMNHLAKAADKIAKYIWNMHNPVTK